jgi:Adenylate and Guanylate cyclase catalytic domain
MAHRPTGTVTFLFTDIEGSTKLWEQYPEAMKAVLAKHERNPNAPRHYLARRRLYAIKLNPR